MLSVLQSTNTILATTNNVKVCISMILKWISEDEIWAASLKCVGMYSTGETC